MRFTTPAPLLGEEGANKNQHSAAEAQHVQPSPSESGGAGGVRGVIIDTLTESNTRLEVARGQKLTLLVPILKALVGPRKREIVLAGEGAEAEVIGLFLGRGDDQVTVQIDTIHAAPNTKGYTNFKAVLGGKSTFEFNGMIKIEAGAQGSNDFLQQDSLMLSSDAKANSVPGLEIEANDVKASHGATAKPVDPEQKFYLMSRGLSEAQAEAMMVMGFLAPVLKRFAEVEWKEKILVSLQQHFNLAHVFA